MATILYREVLYKTIHVHVLNCENIMNIHIPSYLFHYFLQCHSYSIFIAFSTCIVPTLGPPKLKREWAYRRGFVSTLINPLAAIDAKMRHLHTPQVQALSRAH